MFIWRFEITESDVEDANESQKTIDTDGVYDEDIDTKKDWLRLDTPLLEK